MSTSNEHFETFLLIFSSGILESIRISNHRAYSCINKQINNQIVFSIELHAVSTMPNLFHVRPMMISISAAND